MLNNNNKEILRAVCEECKSPKSLLEFDKWSRKQYFGKSESVKRSLRSKPSKMPLICTECWPRSLDREIFAIFKRLESRQRRNFSADLSFDYQQFREWLIQSDYFLLLKRAKRVRLCNRGMHLPSIDRINSGLDYRLDNMQVITIGQNSSKNSNAAVGALQKTMRFFKRLRDKLGLTKYEMARHLGILPQSYYYFEEKARGCSFEVLILIKKKLGLSWEEIGKLIEEEASAPEK